MTSNQKSLISNDDGTIQEPPSLIIFGGTFDPPHNGHLQCLKVVQQKFLKGKILVVPTPEPPPVNQQQKRPVLPFSERIYLMKQLIESMSKNGSIALSDIEASIPPPRFTWKLLSKLQVDYPGDRLGFVIGLDQMRQFYQWSDPIKVLRSAALIVINRHEVGEKLVDDLRKAVVSGIERLNLSLYWKSVNEADILTLDGRTLSKLYVIETPVIDASSRVIRQLLQAEKPIPSAWLPDFVKNHIEQKHYFKVK